MGNLMSVLVMHPALRKASAEAAVIKARPNAWPVSKIFRRREIRFLGF
jgi:hypothetical protein